MALHKDSPNPTPKALTPEEAQSALSLLGGALMALGEVLKRASRGQYEEAVPILRGAASVLYGTGEGRLDPYRGDLGALFHLVETALGRAQREVMMGLARRGR